jgi:AAA+ ATPase superfamily predicted ATPase
MLKLEHSLQRFTNIPKDNTISEKLIFTTPFLRFWFTCISPVFKGVRDGDFKESMKIFENKKTELITFVYEQLAFEVLKMTYKDDEIKTLGRYWDNSSDIITLLAKTQSGKMIAGSIKYTNNKIKTTELNNLKTTCKSFGIEVDTFVLFSKKGFTSELKSLKSDSLKLFSIKNLNLLI